MSAEDEVQGLLAAASKTMASARSCWLVTSTADGGVVARPMGRLKGEPGDEPWLIRFITDARSHKAAEVKRTAKVAVIFEVPADDAYGDGYRPRRRERQRRRRAAALERGI
jgi:general stress protein 26